MNMAEFKFASCIEAPPADVFTWHTRQGAFERLNPPWESVRVLETRGVPPAVGSEVVLQLQLGPLKKQWLARHTELDAPNYFADVQVRGPFASWKHTHTFSVESLDRCLVTDHIEFSLPLHNLSYPLVGPFVLRKLEKMFAYRHHILASDIHTHRQIGLKPQKFLISGSSGLIGNQLTAFLQTGGHSVTRLTRTRLGSNDPASICWDPTSSESLDSSLLEDIDIIIHLGGANIAEKRWSEGRKQELSSSRIQTTQNLVAAIARCNKGPHTFVSASATGIYGSQGATILTEDSAAGSDFLSTLGQAWEAAAQPLAKQGRRTVQLRFGVILTPQGGALQKMLPAFRLGLGAPLGSGEQFMSWCSIEDALRIILFCCANDKVRGPINVCSPNPVTNRSFSKTLAGALRRPLLPPIPAPILRVMFGELADAALLSSNRCQPQKLEDLNYQWRHPDLEHALLFLLGRKISSSQPPGGIDESQITPGR